MILVDTNLLLSAEDSHGCLLCSTDGDFARFPSLAWKNPLASSGDFTFHVMVPESSTFVLAGAGLLGAAGGGRWLRRRREPATQPPA
jgi:LPXTG-motif cell wall-anchored protein